MADFIVSASATGSGTGSLANPFTISQMLVQGGANRYLWRAGVYLRSSPPGMILVGGTGVGAETIWKPYGDGDVVIRDNAVTTTHQPFFKVANAAAGGSADYFICDGRADSAGGGSGTFEFDGNAYNSNMPFQVQGRHHFTMRNCYVHSCGGNGLGVEASDYIYVIANIFGPNGHPSRTDGSQISLNTEGTPLVLDSYDGFHSIIAFNIGVGAEGEPADGNGCILDRGGDGSTVASISSTLIVGNLFAYNGNRGIHVFRCKPVAGGKILVLSNTCANNGLDLLTTTATNGRLAEFMIDSGEADFVNNYALAVADQAGPSTTRFGTTPFRFESNLAAPTIRSYANVYTGGKSDSPWATLAAGSLPTSLATPNLRGVVPAIDTTTSQGHLNAPDPRTLAQVFMPLATSGLKDAGIDPATIPGLTANMLSDLANYINVDLVGHARPS